MRSARRDDEEGKAAFAPHHHFLALCYSKLYVSDFYRHEDHFSDSIPRPFISAQPTALQTASLACQAVELLSWVAPVHVETIAPYAWLLAACIASWRRGPIPLSLRCALAAARLAAAMGRSSDDDGGGRGGGGGEQVASEALVQALELVILGGCQVLEGPLTLGRFCYGRNGSIPLTTLRAASNMSDGRLASPPQTRHPLCSSVQFPLRRRVRLRRQPPAF